jgi:hypothetical protein
VEKSDFANMIDSTSIFALILVLTSFTAVVNGFKAVSFNVGGSIRQQSVVRLSASLKPQITKLIARQDLTTAETEVCGLHSNWFQLLCAITMCHDQPFPGLHSSTSMRVPMTIRYFEY